MNELGQDDGHVLPHLITNFHGNFAERPNGIVAHGDEFRVEILGQDGDELVDVVLQVAIARLDKVAKQCKGALADLVGAILWGKENKCEGLQAVLLFPKICFVVVGKHIN